MAAEKGVVLDASQVSESFVAHYYHIVGTTTHAAHKYYNEDSLVTRPEPDCTMMSFSSLEAIKKHYSSSYYDGTTFDVVSVDSPSLSGDWLFIMVNGLSRQHQEEVYRSVLSCTSACSEHDYGYVVVNDIHRFVNEDSSTTTRACSK